MRNKREIWTGSLQHSTIRLIFSFLLLKDFGWCLVGGDKATTFFVTAMTFPSSDIFTLIPSLPYFYLPTENGMSARGCNFPFLPNHSIQSCLGTRSTIFFENTTDTTSEHNIRTLLGMIKLNCGPCM